MKNKLIRTQFTIMTLIILGKTIGFLRESILASKYGTGYEVDVYGYSINILLFLATIGYSITTTIIPIFTELKENESAAYQEKIANNLISFCIFVGLLISVLSIVFSKFIVGIFAPGFEGETLEVARKLIIIMNFSIVAILVQSVITGILQANEKFYAPAAMALIGNIVIVVYLLFGVDKFGIIGFGIVTVISYFIQLLINIPSYRKLEFRYYFCISSIDDKVKEIIKLSLPVLASTCIMQVSTLVNIFYASLIGTGSISIYNYSNRIISLGVEIFAIGISMVVYPVLSKMSLEKEKSKFNKSLGEGLVLMSMLIIPISILLIILRVDVIKLLYERNEFTSESTIVTSSVLLLLTPTMIAAGIRDLLNKACYSLKEANLPMKASLITIILTIFFNSILYKRLGIMSLGISTSIATIFGTLITLIILKRQFSFIKLNIKISIFKIIIASFFMGIAVFFIREFLVNYLSVGLLSTLFIIFICGISGFIMFILLIFILKIKELKLTK